MQAAYFRVGGRTFDRQDPLGRLTFQGAQHLQTLGALTDYDRYKEDAEKQLAVGALAGRVRWRGASLLRRERNALRWFLDQLVVVRDDERTRLGYVTRVAVGAPNELAMSLALWPGQPRSIAVRPDVDRVRRRAAAAGAHALGDRGEPASLVVPPRTFNAGRMLRSMDTGPERKFRLTKLAAARRRLRARGVRRVVARGMRCRSRGLAHRG